MRLIESAELLYTLADRYKPLDALRAEHLVDYDELLGYLLLADYVRWMEEVVVAEERTEMVRSVLATLDELFAAAAPEARNMVSVQLLENLQSSGEAGAKLEALLGPNLKAELATYPWNQAP